MKPQYDGLTTCQSPIAIYPNGSDTPLITGCGRCDACLSSKRSSWASRMESESRNAVSVLFFTLTYDNANLPVYRFNFDTKTFNHSKYPENHELYNLDLSLIDPYFGDGSHIHPSDYDSISPCFGVVHKPDVQKFFKRLRRYVERDPQNLLSGVSLSDRDIRYFVCSEYGPNTLRPHYHGCLYLRSKRVSESIRTTYFHKSWRLGNPQRCEISTVVCTASHYVSKYLYKFADLPHVLDIPKFTKGFYLCSRRPVFGYCDVDKTDLINRIDSRSILLDKSYIDKKSGSFVNLILPVSSTCRNFYFQKVAFSGYISEHEYISKLLFCFETVGKRISYYDASRTDYKRFYSFISDLLPNYVKDVQSLIDDTNLRLSPTSPYTLDSVIHDLSSDNFWFGVPTNRRFLIRAIILCYSENISPIEYFNLWKQLHTLSTSINISRTFDYWNKLISDGYTHIDAAALCYPSFFYDLPSSLVDGTEDFFRIKNMASSLGLDIFDLYANDTIMSDHSILYPIRFADVDEFLTLHSRTSSHLSYVRWLTMDKGSFEMRRKQKHQKYYY